MRDGIVYCRLHYEMLNHPAATLTVHQQQHPQQQLQQQQHGGLLMSHPSLQAGHTGLISEGPCDLSCGPHHGLLPPTGFHHPHHLMPPESVSPNQHMINILSSADGPVGESPFPSALGRPSLFGAGQPPGTSDYLHNPSPGDFQRCLSNPSSAAGFFSSLSSGGGSGGGGLGAGSPGGGGGQHHVQKGRPRKRKIPSSSASASLHSNNNNSSGGGGSNNNNNNNNSIGIPAGNHSDSSLMGQQLNAANLRQLNSGMGQFLNLNVSYRFFFFP